MPISAHLATTWLILVSVGPCSESCSQFTKCAPIWAQPQFFRSTHCRKKTRKLLGFYTCITIIVSDYPQCFHLSTWAMLVVFARCCWKDSQNDYLITLLHFTLPAVDTAGFHIRNLIHSNRMPKNILSFIQLVDSTFRIIAVHQILLVLYHFLAFQ